MSDGDLGRKAIVELLHYHAASTVAPVPLAWTSVYLPAIATVGLLPTVVAWARERRSRAPQAQARM